MTDAELMQRPVKGWTPWKTATAADIGTTWWQAKELHFPKLNVTVWFDGSDLVGIEHWGASGQQWCMKRPTADWQPAPAGYREEAERIWREWHEARAPAVAA